MLVLSVAAIVLLFVIGSARLFVSLRRRRSRASRPNATIGVLHPNCLGGGGGERVLWVAIEAMLTSSQQFNVCLFGNIPLDFTPSSISLLLQSQFGISLSTDTIDRLHLVPMPNASRWTDPRRYPHLTMLLQSLAGASWAAACLASAPVSIDLLLETTGDPLALPVARYLFGIQAAAYVHYPTISRDMVNDVEDRRWDTVHNRSDWVVRSPALTAIKLLYYRALLRGYAWALNCADMLMANSTWTHGHLFYILRRRRYPILIRLNPPCGNFDWSDDESVVWSTRREAGLILSVGHFRPEKNHELQCEIVSLVDKRLKPKLVALGGPGRDVDTARLTALESSIATANAPMKIMFNTPRAELEDRWLGQAMVGLHTMRDEHFGISVVEMMGHGVIPIAHRSGGVRDDIIVDGVNGFLAESAQEYANAVARVLGDDLGPNGRAEMRMRGREKCRTLSDTAFRTHFMGALEALGL